MADFKSHLAFSSSLGVVYGGSAYLFFDVPVPTSILAAGLCGVSGMLPDIDSGPGKPLRESMAFAAAVIPMMLVPRFHQAGLSPELIVLLGSLIYVFIRFVVADLLRRYTKHRGMFHSLPAAIVFGQIAFLLSSGDVETRIYKAGAVALGYFSHLLLDEFWSLYWKRGHLEAKSSFGSAVKIFGKHLWPNVSTYAKLTLLAPIVFFEPQITHEYCEKEVYPAVQETAERVVDRILR